MITSEDTFRFGRDCFKQTCVGHSEKAYAQGKMTCCTLCQVQKGSKKREKIQKKWHKVQRFPLLTNSRAHKLRKFRDFIKKFKSFKVPTLFY